MEFAHFLTSATIGTSILVAQLRNKMRFLEIDENNTGLKSGPYYQKQLSYYFCKQEIDSSSDDSLVSEKTNI